METSCKVCGEKNFSLRMGFYYCNDCGAKDQNVKAALLNEGTEFVDNKYKKSLKIKATDNVKEQLTSWEIFNYILRGLVDDLINIGAKDEVKAVTMQIWAAYLSYMEVAFFSRKKVELPRLGVYYRQRDSHLLYNHLKRVKAKPKKKRPSTSNASKRKRREDLKSLQQSEYHESLSLLSDTSLSPASTSLSESLSDSSDGAPTDRNIQLQFSTRARKCLKEKMNLSHLKKHEMDCEKKLTCHHIPVKRVECLTHDIVMELSMKKLYAIICIALNLVEDDIQVTDVARFIADGYIASWNVKDFFPENVRENCMSVLTSMRLFGKQLHYPSSIIRSHCGNLCKALRIKQVQTPSILKLVKRYVTELCLPVEIESFIECLINLHPPVMKWDGQTSTPCYESRAMAYIVFTLKLLFGLDGYREEEISESAQLLNDKLAEIGHIQHNQIFVWKDWVKFIETRKLILCKYNSTLRKQFKGVVSRSEYLHELVSSSRNIEKPISRIQVKLESNLERVFNTFMQNHYNQSPNNLPDPIEFKASLTPCASSFNALLSNDNISPNIPAFMKVDRSTYSLQALLKPTELANELASKGIHLNITYLNCPSREKNIGTFKRQNPFQRRPSLYKVSFNSKLKKWKTNLKYEEPYNSIFKENMDTYCGSSVYKHIAKAAKQHNVAASVKSISNPAETTLGMFREDDMNPLELNLTGPRRDLGSASLFENISSHEDKIRVNTNVPTTEEITIKISNMNCWMVLGSCLTITEAESNEIKTNLPLSFFWLLEMCANILGVDWLELYDQLLVIETFFAYRIESLEDFRDRVVFQGTHSIKDINKICTHYETMW